MIKKIIFDIDDTLFNTSVDAKVAYEKFLINYNFNCDSKQLYDALEDVNYIDNCSFEDFYLFLKKFLGEEFNKDIFNEFVEIYINEATLISKSTKDVLEYISSKYELVILSNWFYDLQVGKLRKHDLLKYFKNVYSVDNFGKKPEIETFIRACEPFDFKECVIIGDSLKNDIVIPNKLGMRGIYLGECSECESIKDIKELLEIL